MWPVQSVTARVTCDQALAKRLIFGMERNMRGKLILLSVLLLAGCDKAPESITTAGDDFRVGKLFTVDDCTIYRFYDGGRNVYFSNCRGQTISSYQTGGKTKSTHYDIVPTSE